MKDEKKDDGDLSKSSKNTYIIYAFKRMIWMGGLDWL